jgi:hypothetical protein
MRELVEVLRQAAGGRFAGGLGDRLGLDAERATALVAALVPAVAAALMRQPPPFSGLPSVPSPFAAPPMWPYLPWLMPVATRPDAALVDLFGSPAAAAAVAERVAAVTGLAVAAVRPLLPEATGAAFALVAWPGLGWPAAPASASAWPDPFGFGAAAEAALAPWRALWRTLPNPFGADTPFGALMLPLLDAVAPAPPPPDPFTAALDAALALQQSQIDAFAALLDGLAPPRPR